MIKLSKLIIDFKEVINYCKDKYWFYYVIDGDEFHPKLNLNMKILLNSGSVKAINKEYDRIARDRESPPIRYNI